MTITVLQSFPVPRPDTNPYTTLLERSLRAEPGMVSLNFTWRTALFGRYDVFHAHWPEILVSGHSTLKKLVRQALFAILLLRFVARRTAVVRTVHNVELPQGISRREVLLLQLFDRATTLRIRLNPTTRMPRDSPFETIPHGHYRDWYSHLAPSPITAGRLSYFGTIRRYKGVESLITAFRALSPDGHPGRLTLTVAGNPSSPDLAHAMTELAEGDPRITVDLRPLTDAEVVDIATSSELVVMPYRFMHNSAGVITVLSLGRPLLVPDNEVNQLLSEEVGAGWLFFYRGELTAEDLASTLEKLRRNPAAAPPNLDARDWTLAARAHLAAYRRSIALRHHAVGKSTRR